MLVAPPNKAALQCNACHQWADFGHSALDFCDYCDHTSLESWDTPFYTTALLHSEQEKLDISTVQNITWFHGTERKNWRKYMTTNEALVHVGNKSASLDRMDDLRSWSYTPQDIHLFQICLKDGARIDPKIYTDDEANELDFNTMKYDAVRYVNAWEAIGSVSLVVKSTSILITETELIQVSA